MIRREYPEGHSCSVKFGQTDESQTHTECNYWMQRQVSRHPAHVGNYRRCRHNKSRAEVTWLDFNFQTIKENLLHQPKISEMIFNTYSTRIEFLHYTVLRNLSIITQGLSFAYGLGLLVVHGHLASKCHQKHGTFEFWDQFGHTGFPQVTWEHFGVSQRRT
jgi:hypothetical protein